MWKIFYTRDLCLRAHDTNSLCAGVCVEMRVNMNKNEWYQVGEDIKKQVQQAIDSNDFTELSKSISDTVNQAVGDVSKSINDAVNDVRDSIQQSVQQTANKRAGNVSMNNQTVNQEIGTPAKHQNGKDITARSIMRSRT